MSYFLKLQPSKEKPVQAVPFYVTTAFLIALTMQIALHNGKEQPVALAEKLKEPPSASSLKLISFGEEISLAKILMLKLQSFDNQPGLSIPLVNLDYAKVIAWLERISLLDTKSQYPVLAAMRIYAEVNDEEKRRMLLAYTRTRFLENPNTQWPAMVHAVYIAKHKLKDLPLALQYAQDIRTHVTRDDIHSWVRQMELFVLEDMGKLESARILLGGFLDSGVIKDEREYNYLKERLGVVED